MSDRTTVYDGADRAIRAINRENLRLFGQLRIRLMKTDELHIIQAVTGTFDAALRITEQWLLEVARQAYQRAAEETRKRKRNGLDLYWLLNYLGETDPAALYRFLPEWERKKARLIEALSVSTAPGQEIDKTLRELTKQIGWFAVSVTDAARIQAFKDAGIEEVMWHSEHDDRVCKVCEARNGKVFRTDKLPVKHVNCRCWLTPVIHDSSRETD